MEKSFDIQRIKNAIQWLIFDGKVANRRELAEKMGYGESYFSQVMNGKVPLTESFIKKLSDFDNRLNYKWLINQDDEMLNITQIVCGEHNTSVAGNSNYVNSTETLAKALDEIAEHRKLVAKSQEQIDRLIALLEKNSK